MRPLQPAICASLGMPPSTVPLHQSQSRPGSGGAAAWTAPAEAKPASEIADTIKNLSICAPLAHGCKSLEFGGQADKALLRTPRYGYRPPSVDAMRFFTNSSTTSTT